jgi:hypothetical protein
MRVSSLRSRLPSWSASCATKTSCSSRARTCEQGKIHRVDPKFASRPSSLTENPHKSLRVDPDSGSTL